MVFGEIIEPTSRAFLYEEEEVIPNENLEWNIEAEVPGKIDYLLVSDTKFSNGIISKFLINKSEKPLAKLTKGIATIYQLNEAQYVILCNPTLDTSIGELTLFLLPWLQAASTVYTVTTDSVCNFQNKSLKEHPLIVLRSLSMFENNLCKQLESPNLVTGVSANLLSFCINKNLRCCLFIGYLEHSPIDSMNSQPFIDLLKKLGFKGTGVCELASQLPENNLYT